MMEADTFDPYAGAGPYAHSETYECEVGHRWECRWNDLLEPGERVDMCIDCMERGTISLHLPDDPQKLTGDHFERILRTVAKYFDPNLAPSRTIN